MSLISGAAALAVHRETLVAHWRVNRLRRAPPDAVWPLARAIAQDEAGRVALEPLALADGAAATVAGSAAWGALLEADFGLYPLYDSTPPPPPPQPPERRLVGYVLHAAAHDDYRLAGCFAGLESVPPTVVAMATRLALEGTDDEAYASARALSRRPRDARVRPMFERIALESPWHHARAIAILALIEEPDSVSREVRRLVEREVDGSSPLLREASAQGLVALASDGAATATRLLASPHDEVIQVAFEALARAAKETVVPLAFAHPNAATRRWAHTLLPIHVGSTPEVLAGHRRALEDPVELVRLAAAHALARTGDGSGLAIAVAGLRNNAPPELLVRAADALHTLRASTAVPALVAAHDRTAESSVLDATSAALAVTTGRSEATTRAPWAAWLAATPGARDRALDPDACFAATRRDGVAAVGSRAP